MKSRIMFLLLAISAALAAPVRGAETSEPAVGEPSKQTYRVRWIPEAGIELDGRLEEWAWRNAVADKRFRYPWKRAQAPATEFRAFCDGANLYFGFRVTDKDIVVLQELRDEEDEVFEDRVEIYLCRDDQMRDYYCFEVDSKGRVFDYRASFYRRFDTKWKFEGLETRAAPLKNGYQVEGRIPLKALEALGFPPARPGVRILCGLYRAEFSHDRTGRKVEPKESLHNLGRTIEGPPPIEEWISWVDPKIKEPDFHVAASLGWLEFDGARVWAR